jgi:hypothetical protein
MAKMQMLLGVVLLVGLVMVSMPGKLISRYKTIADDQVEDDEMDVGMRDSALNSTQSRKALLRNSIKFTFQHPLFGVGPGCFGYQYLPYELKAESRLAMEKWFAAKTPVKMGGLGPGKIPDIPTWAVRDYGNRVGIVRVMQVLDRYGIRATVALNSDICINHPAIIEEGCARRWEWMGAQSKQYAAAERG